MLFSSYCVPCRFIIFFLFWLSEHEASNFAIADLFFIIFRGFGALLATLLSCKITNLSIKGSSMMNSYSDG